MKSPKGLSPKQADLLHKHDLAMRNLDDYSAFLEAWQTLIDENDTDELPDLQGFADFERYATYAVHSFLETGHTLSAGDLAQHECGAALVTGAGMIKQVNAFAGRSQNLTPGRSLSTCGITFEGDSAVGTLLQKKEKDRRSTFHLVQAEDSRSGAPVVLAISRIDADGEDDPLFLVLFIVPPDVQSTVAIMANKFNFTSAEAEIAEAFLEGRALRDIATQRGRSYVTIRNQFQRILEKSGCASQTELFRLSFSLFSLIGNPVETRQGGGRKVSRTMTLPRPNGRVVELTLSGDEEGRPVLNLPSLFGHGVTPEIEDLLRDRGVLFVSLMRPGFGGTSPPAQDQDLYSCLAGDVRAILDSLEIPNCPCVARASAGRPFYNLAAQLPDRIDRGIVVNGLIPREYIEGKSVVSKWTTALMSASIVSYPVAMLILGTGNSLLTRSHGASFLKRMYQNSESDCAALDDPDAVACIRAGVHQVTQQGLGAGVQEMVDGFQNWSAELRALRTPVTVYHGVHDPNVPIAGVREFVGDNAHCLTLVEETEGGGLLNHSHTARIIDLALGDE
ncbi:alpha/beta hydrolase [Nitratireductor sp. XY-223]|uniref:alpha/beta hydrolase n=1 Tax=Nitratireductor sp. XY-223 TaxID=2561926 RepID=UPI0010AA2808|nr:alpha/beta hydrolase [Nitratireductor sp. XY-223]